MALFPSEYVNKMKHLWAINICVLSLYNQTIFSQESNFKIPDSLENKSYEYLTEKLEHDNNTPQLDKLYGNVFLKKALQQQDWGQLANAWKNIVHKSDKSIKLIYADSMIVAAKRSNGDAVLAHAYITKGVVYYGLNRYREALDQYLLADKHIAAANDKYYTYQIKLLIGQVKWHLSFYDEAIALFQECINYYKEDGGKPYIIALRSLAICYQKTNRLDLASATNSLGIAECASTNDTDMISYFINNEGINQFYKGNYKVSITKLNQSYAVLVNKKDEVNKTATLFYLGKNYWALGMPETAIPYFEKLDAAFKNDTFIRPEMIEAYDILIKYHENDNAKQSYYKDQLLKLKDYYINVLKYLPSQIHDAYENKKLQQANSEIEHSRNNIIIIAGVLFLFFSAILLLQLYKRNSAKRIKKQKLQKFHQNKKKPEKPESSSPDKLADINPEIVKSIKDHTDQLKTTKQFLEKNLTVGKLATRFNSNQTYVSRVINDYKGCKVMEYIYDLKIDYIIEMIETQKKYRNYTNQALADEAGFSTKQQFVKTFEKRVGVTPTFFIEQHIEKNEQ